MSPYLTRHLGDVALGNYVYINSIAYYFIVFANLGISKHGQRIIASSQDEEQKRRRFWSLFFVHSLISFLSIILYCAFIFVFVKDNASLYFIETIYVASALFDITWLFYGLQNFKGVVVRNALVKVLECALVFIFVKDSNDLPIYFIIMSSCVLAGHLILLPSAIRVVKPIKFSNVDIREHFKPLILFSITVIAITMYTVFDKTLIGAFLPKENVAYYEYGNNVVKIPLYFISVVGTVMYPKACELSSKGDLINQEKYLNKSLFFVFFIGSLSLFGFLSLSLDFATYYYGEQFIESGRVMIAMSILPLIVGLGDVVRTQFLIPNHMDRHYLICILVNAGLNVLLSSILIRSIGIYGAVIGTVSAETFGTIYQLICCKKVVKLKTLFRLCMTFLVIGFLMFKTIDISKTFLGHSFISLIIEIGIGVFTYALLSLSYYLFDKKRC